MVGSLPEGPATPEDAPRHSAIFTVASFDQEGPVRRFPGLFFGKAQMYADRDAAKLQPRLARLVEASFEAVRGMLFLLQACEIDGRRGLYGRDMMNRSAYRQKLTRAGVRFADDPFVQLTDDRLFSCRDWGAFEADFAILRGWGDTTEDIARPVGAELLFDLTTFRLGKFAPQELAQLKEAANKIEAVAGLDANAVLKELTQ